MKLKNSQLVRFINSAGAILEQKMPYALYQAIDLNVSALNAGAMSYKRQYDAIMQDEKKTEEEKTAEIAELLEVECEYTLQQVPGRTLEMMDASDKFDALTGAQMQAIAFMIQR